MTFKSLQQRIASGYLTLFPEFVPDKKSLVSAQQQKEFYDFIKSFYQLAYDEPLLFVPKVHYEDFIPKGYFTFSSCGKQDLAKNMNKFLNAVNEILIKMYFMGIGIDVKLNKKRNSHIIKVRSGCSKWHPCCMEMDDYSLIV